MRQFFQYDLVSRQPGELRQYLSMAWWANGPESCDNFLSMARRVSSLESCGWFAYSLHCVQRRVSWAVNHTIRSRIRREYGEIRRCRAYDTRCVRNRIFPESDFFRGGENPMSEHVVETRRVEARKFDHSSRFAKNSGVPCTEHKLSSWAFLLILEIRCLLFAQNVRFQTKLHGTGGVSENHVPYNSRYVTCHSRTCYQKFHCSRRLKREPSTCFPRYETCYPGKTPEIPQYVKNQRILFDRSSTALLRRVYPVFPHCFRGREILIRQVPTFGTPTRSPSWTPTSKLHIFIINNNE